MTTDTIPLVGSPPRSKGRGLFWLGLGLVVLAVAAVFVQYSLKKLFMPWYFPAFLTLAAVFVLCSFLERKTIIRFLAFGLVAFLAAATWYMLAFGGRLPVYEGPVQVGQPLPAFETTLADGGAFTNQSLQDGMPTVMVFFRGRW